ncbi:MAG TPA: PEP-CTERM sorting domain-containing protein [Edaphobacter sp.]|jgi:hypothetical protein|nr:PEP-CTERM sorting domain-containing protein [Edaphobacter sp.]
MIKKLFSLSCLCLLGFVASAKADTIGPSNCGSCLGSSYTLTYTATANPDIFDIFLKVDTSATTLSTSDLLNAVAPKVSSSFTNIAFVSGPFGTVQDGGLAAGGCNGSGAGFFCSGGTGLAIGSGKVYNWEWAITLASPGDLFTGSNEASIKASFVTPAGGNAGITSEDITLQPGTTPSVPEPSTLMLLGTGALGLAGAIKRRLA